jgi:hypothetical protein
MAQGTVTPTEPMNETHSSGHMLEERLKDLARREEAAAERIAELELMAAEFGDGKGGMLLALDRELASSRTKIREAEARRGALQTILYRLEITVQTHEMKVSKLEKAETSLLGEMEQARRELLAIQKQAAVAAKSASSPGQSPPSDWEALKASIVDLLSPSAFDSLTDPARQLHWAIHLIDHVDAVDQFAPAKPGQAPQLRLQLTEALCRVHIYEFTLQSGALFDESLERLAATAGASAAGYVSETLRSGFLLEPVGQTAIPLRRALVSLRPLQAA